MQHARCTVCCAARKKLNSFGLNAYVHCMYRERAPIKYPALTVNSSTWKIYFIILFDTSFFSRCRCRLLLRRLLFLHHPNIGTFNGFGKTLDGKECAHFGECFYSTIVLKAPFLPEITSMEIVEMQH